MFSLVVAIFIVMAFFAWLAGFRVNVTASLPLGLYRLTNEVPRRGSIAFFCLESPEFRRLAREREYVGPGGCPGGIRALGKEVYGLPGDTVGIEADGSISINNQVQRRTTAKGDPCLLRHCLPVLFRQVRRLCCRCITRAALTDVISG